MLSTITSMSIRIYQSELWSGMGMCSFVYVTEVVI
ncbi:putative restriction modification system DNA specificity domain protein [Burkholderia pseudomallei MSHR5492]|nr:putative restriction modification system DNA specificity domain protein [Burkholderia pseudomallei MSHR5492]